MKEDGEVMGGMHFINDKAKNVSRDDGPCIQSGLGCGHRRGLTLTDLIIGLCCFALLLVFAIPYIQHGVEFSRRAVCANNLRQVGLAAMMYAHEERRTGCFPRVQFDESTPTPTQYTGAGRGVAVNEADIAMWSQGIGFYSPIPPPSPNDVTASIYLIYFTQFITSSPFVCPGANATPFPFGNLPYRNFPSRQYLSYSYNNPFPSQSALKAGWRFDNTLGPDSPLAADMNPGQSALSVTARSTASELRAANSTNHNSTGQNVVYCDGHVEFQTTPYCGRFRPSLGYRDNIYTYGVSASAGGIGVSGPAQDAEDSVLLPTTSDGLQPPKLPWRQRTDLPISVSQAVLAAVLLVIAIVAPFHLHRRIRKVGMPPSLT